MRHGLTSLICIGKTLAAGEAGRAAEVLGRPVLCLIHGSVTPGDCAKLFTRPQIDGLFIGRSARVMEGYLDILDRCARAL